MNLTNDLNELDNLLAEGNFLEAVERFFDDQVVCFSNPHDMITGKSSRLSTLRDFLATIDRVEHITLHNNTHYDQISLSEFSFEFKQNSGQVLFWREVIKRKWENGQVVEEEYQFDKNWEEAVNGLYAGTADKRFRQQEFTPGISKDGDWIRIVEEVKQEIPDNDEDGLASQVKVDEKGVVEDIEVEVDINHTFRGDLYITLTGPSKETVVLQNREGASRDNLHKIYDNSVMKPFLGSKAKGKWTIRVVDAASRDVGQFNWWRMDVKVTEPDDLKKIEGIGPKLATVLKDAGILTFLDLANMAPSEIETVLVAYDPKYTRYDPATWPQQARLAYLGKWEELKELQDELQGGRKV